MPPKDSEIVENYYKNSNNLDLRKEGYQEIKENEPKGFFLTKVIWPAAIAMLLYHVAALYILFTFPFIDRYKTALFANFYNFLGALGVTVGIHRYFTHRSFKARTPLKILLLIFYSISGQHSVRRWVRDHRVHHKCSDTMGDPYNARRGFLFCFVGWSLMEKHSEFRKYAKYVSIDDVINDPYIRFFDTHIKYVRLFFVYVVPIGIPMYFWNETFNYAFQMAILRHVVVLCVTNTINGFGHTFGEKTYNSKIQARENLLLSIITNGEGYHNYHHTFPYDYKASERGKFNVSTYTIDFFAKLGLAYDLQEAGENSIKKMTEKCGSRSTYC